MDKYRIRSMLREKDGLNGLRIIQRIPNRPQDRTNKPLIPEPVKKIGAVINDNVSGLMKRPVKVDGDLRHFNGTGKSIEDYCITGEGRPPIVIREVQTTVPGIKKYALIDLPQETPEKKPIFMSKKKAKEAAKRPVTYNVRYVYSEGIDIEKMAEDAEYANAVIKLLQETRLKKKEDLSRSMGTDVVYLGTITKGENGYVLSGITDYASAMITISKIDAAIKQGEVQAKQKYQKAIKEEQEVEEKEEVDTTIHRFTDNQMKYAFYEIGIKLGIPEEKLKQLEEFYIKSDGTTRTGKPEEESVWDEPLN